MSARPSTRGRTAAARSQGQALSRSERPRWSGREAVLREIAPCLVAGLARFFLHLPFDGAGTHLLSGRGRQDSRQGDGLYRTRLGRRWVLRSRDGCGRCGGHAIANRLGASKARGARGGKRHRSRGELQARGTLRLRERGCRDDCDEPGECPEVIFEPRRPQSSFLHGGQSCIAGQAERDPYRPRTRSGPGRGGLRRGL